MHESNEKSKYWFCFLILQFSTLFTVNVIMVAQLLLILRSGHYSSYRKEASAQAHNPKAWYFFANLFSLNSTIIKEGFYGNRNKTWLLPRMDSENRRRRCTG